MDTTILGGKVQAAYAAWMRNLTVLAAALGLAGTLLMGGAIVDGGTQEASAKVAEEVDLAKLLFALEESLSG
jgi:hypothetical protein